MEGLKKNLPLAVIFESSCKWQPLEFKPLSSGHFVSLIVFGLFCLPRESRPEVVFLG